MRTFVAALALFASAPAGAQSSGCARDGSGGLKCGLLPDGHGPAQVKAIARADLAADAVARSKAQAKALEEAAERLRSAREAQAARERSDACAARLEAGEEDADTACGL